jgi:hypothetical protein
MNADLIAAWRQERDEWVRLCRDIAQEMRDGRVLTDAERNVVEIAIARVEVLDRALRLHAPPIAPAPVAPIAVAPAPRPRRRRPPPPVDTRPRREDDDEAHPLAVRRWLTEEDCWRQVLSWQDEPNGGDWHRERVYADPDPDRCFACGSSDVCWNGRSWWCNRCDAIVEPDDATWSTVVVHDVPLPAFPYPVAPFDQDEADYREATRLFRVGALEARAHGWVSPHRNRLREGQPDRRWR